MDIDAMDSFILLSIRKTACHYMTGVSGPNEAFCQALKEDFCPSHARIIIFDNETDCHFK
jgi:hypothetical protein